MTTYDCIIIGAGAAGLTAAIYACRGNLKTLVLEATTYGGQIVNTTKIENYPAAPHISGTDFAKKLYDQALELGAEIKFEKVTSITSDKVVTTEDSKYQARTIIIATGSAERQLGLENEDALTGRGVSYCATCDGTFFKGKTVAINGGGNTALYSALYLADIAKEVFVIHRRDEFRADPALVDKVSARSNVHFILNAEITALDSQDGHLSGLQILHKSTKKTETLPLSGLFVSIGRSPATKLFAGVVALDKDGFIESSDACETSAPGIFVAGDNRKKHLHQLVTATSDGAIAASSAINYLKNQA